MIRQVAVFTSSRADLGPLGPVIAALGARDDVALTVVATGTHLSQDFGGRMPTVAAGSDVHVIDAGVDGTAPGSLGSAFGRIAAGLSELFASRPIDVLVLLGDRWELLAAAGAALLHGVTIAHLHGGETTEGAIDERIRHGVTKLADLHLCATNDSARRIRRMGEEPRRIHVTGAPGLDRLRDVEPLVDVELGGLLGRPVVRPFGVVVFHPPTVDRHTVGRQAAEVFDAVAQSLGSAVVLHPGADPGTGDVVREIDAAITRHDNLVAIRNLGDEFTRVLASADVQVGNSSSGIIEAASLRLPVVDVGDRQAGRLRPANVTHVDGGVDAIRKAIMDAVAPARRASLDQLENPYGDGCSGRRIAEIIASVSLDDLARKPLTGVEDDDVPLVELLITRTATLRDAVEAIDRGRRQIALVVDSDLVLVGTVSDGDVRRAVLAGVALDASVAPHMTSVPVVASASDSDDEVLALMDRESIAQVPVLDEAGRLLGLHTLQSIVGRASSRVPSTPTPFTPSVSLTTRVG